MVVVKKGKMRRNLWRVWRRLDHSLNWMQVWNVLKGSVWPDWDQIFGISWQHIYCKSSPNVCCLFGQLWKPSLFKSNWWGFFWATFLKNLGYFLFQHLVVLFMVFYIFFLVGLGPLQCSRQSLIDKKLYTSIGFLKLGAILHISDKQK